MGGAASKAAAPKTASNVGRAAAAVSGSKGPTTRPAPSFSWTKDDAIKQDAQDPTSLAATNLGKLGVANVNHPGGAAPRLDNKMLDMLSVRRSEKALADSPTKQPNRLSARSLTILLDECKAASSMFEVEKLAKEFGVDVETLKRVAKDVSSPSVTRIPGKRKGDEEHLLAHWVSAMPSERKALPSSTSAAQ